MATRRNAQLQTSLAACQFLDTVTALRADLFTTDRELASVADIDTTTVWRWRNGKHPPSERLMRHVAARVIEDLKQRQGRSDSAVVQAATAMRAVLEQLPVSSSVSSTARDEGSIVTQGAAQPDHRFPTIPHEVSETFVLAELVQLRESSFCAAAETVRHAEGLDAAVQRASWRHEPEALYLRAAIRADLCLALLEYLKPEQYAKLIRVADEADRLALEYAAAAGNTSRAIEQALEIRQGVAIWRSIAVRKIRDALDVPGLLPSVREKLQNIHPEGRLRVVNPTFDPALPFQGLSHAKPLDRIWARIERCKYEAARCDGAAEIEHMFEMTGREVERTFRVNDCYYHLLLFFNLEGRARALNQHQSARGTDEVLDIANEAARHAILPTQEVQVAITNAECLMANAKSRGLGEARLHELRHSPQLSPYQAVKLQQVAARQGVR